MYDCMHMWVHWEVGKPVALHGQSKYILPSFILFSNAECHPMPHCLTIAWRNHPQCRQSCMVLDFLFNYYLKVVPASFRFQFHFSGRATCSLSLNCLIKSSCGVFQEIEDQLRVVNRKYDVLICVGFDILM